MFDPIDFDLAMVAPWPVRPRLPDVADEARAAGAARDILLETKAAAEPTPGEALQLLLNEMTLEMRLQFEAFRTIRMDAEALLKGAPDEAEIKLAKADIKSATDALALLVRTIEKIDSLQRSLADDRERAIEKNFDETAYNDLLAGIERKIEARARERADIISRDHGGEAGLCAGAGPPSRSAGQGLQPTESQPA
jgi:hypothetical protein